jgi:hypothetical protein
MQQPRAHAGAIRLLPTTTPPHATATSTQPWQHLTPAYPGQPNHTRPVPFIFRTGRKDATTDGEADRSCKLHIHGWPPPTRRHTHTAPSPPTQPAEPAVITFAALSRTHADEGLRAHLPWRPIRAQIGPEPPPRARCASHAQQHRPQPPRAAAAPPPERRPSLSRWPEPPASPLLLRRHG